MIGITATIPVEILFAAEHAPVDLNNLFITSEAPTKLLAQAEAAGFSHNICAWIKGIYATVINHDIKQVIAVTGGDCSNTIALGEVFLSQGVTVIPFEYPLNRDRDRLWAQMDQLRQRLHTTWEQIECQKKRLDGVRKKLKLLDKLTHAENVVTGLENHQFLVSSSDFKGNISRYETELDEFLRVARKRRPRKREIRLGYLGVPPVFGGFYEFIETLGARVVYNEVQRQFSMPFETDNLVDQFLEYTYPYTVEGRLRDVEQAIKERHLHGLIHYTQTFCYRQIYDMIFRQYINLPILTLEGDRPAPLDGRTAFRIETFVEMLRDRHETSRGPDGTPKM